MDANLTEPNPELAKLIKQTPDGMAHWAGTGPSDKTCGQCKHLGAVYPHAGKTKYLSRCQLYQRRANGRVGGKLPPNTPACKYFEMP